MAVSQDLIFTVLPFGQSTLVLERGGQPQTFLDFSVVITPRLNADSPSTQKLGSYRDWADASTGGTNVAAGRTWPETVAAFQSTLQLSLSAPVSRTYPASIISAQLADGSSIPDRTRYAALLSKDTDVTPFVFKGAEKRRLRSAPVGSTVDALHGLYGQFGYTSPTQFPAYADIVAPTAFAPMGFQESASPTTGRSGEDRKGALSQALEETLKRSRAVPYKLDDLGASTGIPGAATSLAFLQHQAFHQRDLPSVQPELTTSPPVPDWDFHKIVGGLGSLPAVQRTLGLVLEFRAGPIDAATLASWNSGLDLDVQLRFTDDPASLFLTPTNVVAPLTHSHVAKGEFRPTTKTNTPTDHTARMLKLGDTTLYRVIRVDHDSAAIKAIQFANNVTRSRKNGKKLTSSTPDRYALPALRTGGFAISRSGRAVQMAAVLQRQTTDLQDVAFASPAGTLHLYEDDLIRGYRFDVLDVEDGIWRSLMWRQGTVAIGDADPLQVTEEDTVVPAPTTATRGLGDNADLYLQETLTRWDGWSLAVPRIGLSAQGIGPSTDTQGSSGVDLPITTLWHVPGSFSGGGAEKPADNAHRLPRLRFGRTYQLRARAADLAGNSLPVLGAPTGAAVVSAPTKHLRFEPVAAPRVLLVQKEDVLPGGTEEVVVIRSESATVNGSADLDNGVSTRIVVPGPSSVFMAEQHGAFDATAAGKPMSKSQVTYQAIVDRDAANIVDDAVLARSDSDPTLKFGTTNPLLYPPFLPIKYLPDVLGRTALVRNLPINAFKQTTATLPFDTAAKGWPNLQATRLRLARGQTTWTTKPVTDPDSGDVTTELDLMLDKGVMVTTLVNCGIQAPAVTIMAMWEWIQDYAKAHNKSTTAVANAILAGEHWMFTPWRTVTFVHAVRTPLLKPTLLLKPAKALGLTYASFVGTKSDPTTGTVLLSRRSTARVDVEASWAMPIDTGTNDDPVKPMVFQAHAFSIEPTRTGSGWAPGARNTVISSVDAQNLDIRHEFNDTKFRAVTYAGTATSFYVEYFREQLVLPDAGGDLISALPDAAIKPGVAFEASTAELVLSWTGSDHKLHTRKLVAAPPGTDPDTPAPTPGDYVVVEDPTLNTHPATAKNGTVQVLKNSGALVPNDVGHVSVEFSYVGPTIHTFSNPTADHSTLLHVLNSARPKAPKVLYVMPIYKRSQGSTSVTRTGGGLRVYLDRPWWSSGDEERLGVVCWHPRFGDSGTLPAKTIAPYVTQWGFDPIFKSANMPAQPGPASFPLATSSITNGSLTLEESTTKVDVAGHDVGFDTDRGLWYCDIQVTNKAGNELTSYTPFIRLALARYQPFSVADAHLSRVVVADYAQLAPDRHVTMTGSGSVTRTVTVVGRAPRATSAAAQPSRIVVIVEEQDTRFTDDELAWSPATGPNGFSNRVTMTAVTSGSSDLVTWRASVPLPRNNSKPLRLTFEEYERIDGGDSGDPNAAHGPGRLAFTESIQIAR